MPGDPYALARTAAGRLAELTGRPRHDALVVLGSGWAPLVESWSEPDAAFAVQDLPGLLAPVTWTGVPIGSDCEVQPSVSVAAPVP
ncbi:MAG: hypothetical protein ACTHOK_20075, partial [Nocardioidaceae bacterium]